MVGMDRRTGLPITGLEHLWQSIEDILSTPLGSRRMKPEYGSGLRRYVDLPITEGWKGAVQAEAARALGRWEPRVDVGSIKAISVIDGRITFRLAVMYLGETKLLEVSA